VTLDGKALAKGQVTFTDKDGRTFSGSIEDGTYRLAKVPVGAYEVSVTGHVAPVLHADPNATGFSFQVKQGPNVYDLAMKGETKSYAVVSLHNNSVKPLRYRYRWTGEKEWKEGTIAPDGKVVHELPLADGAKLPDFEIEGVSEDGRASLKPAKWSGNRRPAYEDGEEYNIKQK
jgi:hypothetical protein